MNAGDGGWTSYMESEVSVGMRGGSCTAECLADRGENQDGQNHDLVELSDFGGVE